MRALLLAGLFLLFGADAADAGPLIGAAVALAGPAFAVGTLGGAVGSLALSFGLSYGAGLLLDNPNEVPRPAVGGGELDLTVDSGVPRKFIFGMVATAGSLAYAKTYGKNGEGGNSDLIEIIALADHPVESTQPEAIIVNGKEKNFIPATSEHGEGVTEGQRVEDYRSRLFFKFYNGTQTAADALAVAKLGTANNQPWTSAMVGQGVCYARVHATFHPTILTSPPEIRFVIKGAKFYDPRKDTSVGGSGNHRFTTISTHEWSDNVMVIAYNILRGFYVMDGAGVPVRQHFYGLKRTTSAHLPLTEWFAAMNACDEPISDANPTARYRASGEISVDTEPREALLELMKCCGGSIQSVGGVFKPYIGVPELPVIELTDDDILDQEDSFRPIQPLSQRVNYVTGRYTSPVRWAEKIAVPRSDEDFEAEDGRRMPAELNAPMVQYGPQMQLLMRQFLHRNRRARKHIISLPPKFFKAEAGQSAVWNSTRNGYIDKLFTIEGVEYHGNLCVTLTLLEVDPSDYDWETDFELPEDDDENPSNVPEPKAVLGFDAVGVNERGDLDTVKPGIRFTWTSPGDPDISRVMFQIRRPSFPLNKYNDNSSDPEDGRHVYVGGLAPLTVYEVRAKFDSFSGNDSDWTDPWKSVTTTNAKLNYNDFVSGLKHELETGFNARIDSVTQTADLVAELLVDLQTKTVLETITLDTELVQTKKDITTEYKAHVSASIGPDSAIGHQLETLNSAINGPTGLKARIKAEWVTGVKPGLAIAFYELLLTAIQAQGGKKVRAGMSLVAKIVDGVRVGEIWFDADHFMVGKTGDNLSYKPVFVISTVNGKAKVLVDGEILALSLKAARAEIGSLSAITANLGTVTAGKIIFTKKSGGTIIRKMELLDDCTFTIWNDD